MPTQSLAFSIISIIFYLLMAVFALYSLISIYSLLRFGQTKILGIIISILYLVVSAALYASAVSNLSNLNL